MYERKVKYLSYTDWYKETYNDEWTIDHAPLISLLDEYEKWCEKNKVNPIWNG